MARAWAALGVLDRPVVRDLVARVLDEWSQAWFVQQRFAVSYWKTAKSDTVNDKCGAGWTTPGNWVGVSCSWRASRRLAEHALDVRLSEMRVGQGDEKVLSNFEARLLEDLANRVESAFCGDLESEKLSIGPNGPFEGGGGVIVGVALPDAPTLLSISIPVSRVVRFCRTDMRPSDGQRPTLTPRLKSIAAVQLQLEAILGQVEISIPELRALVVGDVLVLDRGLDDLVDVAASRSGSQIAQARFTEREGCKAVALASRTWG